MNKYIISAYSKNRVIGKNGKIPWYFPEDLKHFKELTINNVVIMGRKTFDEIYKKFNGPLPGRFTIVVSNSRNFVGNNLWTVGSFEEAVGFAEKNFPDKKLFFCGGRTIYEKAILIVDEMFITEISEEFDGDVYFPDFSEDDFQLLNESKVAGTSIVFKLFSRK